MRQNRPNELDADDQVIGSTGKRDHLTTRQNRAIQALVTSRTVAQAAKKADVSPRSISRWMQNDENFQRELRAARRQVLAQATIQLQQIAGGAVEALDGVIHAGESSAASKISGARAALDFAYRAVEIEDLEERLAAVERRLKENPPAKPAVNVRWVELHNGEVVEEAPE